MIALGGPKLKQRSQGRVADGASVSMIALGGPKLKPHTPLDQSSITKLFQ